MNRAVLLPTTRGSGGRGLGISAYLLLLGLHDASCLLERLHLMRCLLLLLQCHLLLLVYDALLNDRIDLLDGRPRIIREEYLLLARDPLLLLEPQLVHLLLLVQALPDLLVGPGRCLCRRGRHSRSTAVCGSWRV